MRGQIANRDRIFWSFLGSERRGKCPLCLLFLHDYLYTFPMPNSTSSPPSSVEQRVFHVPELDSDDQGEEIFTFLFSIEETGSKPIVTFTVSLNEQLQQGPSNFSSASPPQPVEYKFTGDTCDFVFVPAGGYYVKGSIRIIYFSGPQGNFFNDRCNLNFDLEYGRVGESPAQVLGLYTLVDPNAPSS